MSVVIYRRLRYIVVAAMLALGLCLSGCTGEPVPQVPSTPTATATKTPKPSPSATKATPPAKSATPAPQPPPKKPKPSSKYATAKAELNQLQVKGKASMTGYSREQFYKSWTTKDYCSTAEVILHRDLVKITEGTDCRVTKAILHDPYTGEDITYEPGGIVQIDHIVAIGNAWVTGAKYWSADKRKAYANDPTVLLAVSGRQNAIKQAGDAAEWLPPNKAYRCTYVAKQIKVKHIYKLWVTPAEKQAMATVLAKC